VPAFQKGEVFLVLDVDSDKLDDFDAVDQRYLEALMGLLEKTSTS
jgi:GAF domain-containing protein